MLKITKHTTGNNVARINWGILKKQLSDAGDAYLIFWQLSRPQTATVRIFCFRANHSGDEVNVC